MRKNDIEDAGFRPEPQENPSSRWGERIDQRTPAEAARRDMQEIAHQHTEALRRALDDSGFKLPNNA